MAKNKYFIGAAIVVLAAVGTLFVLNTTQILTIIGVSPKAPVFSFDTATAPGWWSTENYNSQASADDNDKASGSVEKLPVASINIFKGKKGDTTTACFVMYSYYNYKADLETLPSQKMKNSNASDNNIRKVGALDVSMKTPAGTKSYILNTYERVGPDSVDSMKGEGYGTVDLGDGYVTVNAVCPIVDDLATTTSAIGAASLIKE